jgi:hypothetical protein
MGARNKLNSAAMKGFALISAIAGLAFQSLFVALVVAGILLITSINNGELRFSPMNHRR